MRRARLEPQVQRVLRALLVRQVLLVLQVLLELQVPQGLLELQVLRARLVQP